jgi:hypothetical protein
VSRHRIAFSVKRRIAETVVVYAGNNATDSTRRIIDVNADGGPEKEDQEPDRVLREVFLSVFIVLTQKKKRGRGMGGIWERGGGKQDDS